jgi:hypothetical protein
MHWARDCLSISFILYYIITLRIQGLSLVESHDLLEDKRNELCHTKNDLFCTTNHNIVRNLR